MEACDNLSTSLDDASLASSTGAESQDEVGVFITDHGAGVIGLVVSSRAGGRASRARDGDASRVVGVVLHGRNNLHTTSREWVAVDVGQVVGNLAIGPGELELRDGAGSAGLRRELNRDTDTLLTVALAVAALELLHAGVGATADGGVVDGEAAVVDHGGSSHGGDTRGRGKQHGCASDESLELHV